MFTDKQTVSLSFFNTFVFPKIILIMIKNFLVVLSFFLALNAVGQAKKITLEDGVLQQNRAFRADKL